MEQHLDNSTGAQPLGKLFGGQGLPCQTKLAMEPPFGDMLYWLMVKRLNQLLKKMQPSMGISIPTMVQQWSPSKNKLHFQPSPPWSFFFRHSFWHTIWKYGIHIRTVTCIFWHSFWHIVWYSIWHKFLTFYLASILTFFLTFCLASIVTFFLAFYLTFWLAFSLACVRVQAWPASGAGMKTGVIRRGRQRQKRRTFVKI